MFTNCPYCRYLVALGNDGLPPPRCPNCARRLREDTPAEARAAQAEHAAGAGTTADAADTAPAPAASVAGRTPAHAATLDDAAGAAPSPAAPVDPGRTEAVDDDAGAGSGNGAIASDPPAPTGGERPRQTLAASGAAPGTEKRQAEKEASAPSRSIAGPAPETHAGDVAIASADAPDIVDAAVDPPVPAPAAEPASSEGGGDAVAPTSLVVEPDDPVPAASAVADQIALADPPQEQAQPIQAETAFAAPIAEAAIEPAGADSDSAPGWAAPSGRTPGIPTSQGTPADTFSHATPNAAQTRARPAAPSFARAAAESTRPAGQRRSRLQLGAIGALALLLALQLAIADRARLAGDARWRPAIAALCGALRCSLPPWREPQAFALLQRNVQPHASIPGALRVTANFRNDARWPQPWPALQLTLSDVDGREAGTRIFSPREYLGAAPTQTALESGQSAAIALDILEPSPQVVAFTFDFR